MTLQLLYKNLKTLSITPQNMKPQLHLVVSIVLLLINTAIELMRIQLLQDILRCHLI